MDSPGTSALKAQRHLLGFGFSMTFLSSFGQTFVISLFLPSIQESFSLSDAGFSSIYAAATIASALSITIAGARIDRSRLTRYSGVVILGLVCSLVLFSQARNLLFLGLALYGVRLFGQGLFAHIAVTSMARLFDEGRGKAISIANLGHSAGEAVLPIIVVSAIAWLGWRGALLGSSALVLISLPILLYMLLSPSGFGIRRRLLPQVFNKREMRQIRPWQLIASWPFWVMMPASIASAALGTGFLLFKLKLGLAKGWEPAFIGAGFMAYALGNALSNLLAGFLADRFTAKRMFPWYLLPGSLGILAMILGDDPYIYLLFIGGIGATNGFGGTIKSGALAELYGTRIIGSVRSLFTTFMIFATALGPLLFGFMLDAGYSFESIGKMSLLIFLLCTLNSLRILKPWKAQEG